MSLLASTRMRGATMAILVLPLASSCFSTVTVPEISYYRIRAPEPPRVDTSLDAGAAHAPRLALRAVELSADLVHDRIMVAETAVRSRFFELHRWSGPLDALVCDAWITGLSRSGRFAAVDRDVARADLLVDVRVSTFALGVTDQGGWGGDARLEVRLSDAGSDRVLFAHEWRHVTPVTAPEAERAVAALSTSLDRVVLEFLAECEHEGVFAADRPEAVADGPAATPGPGSPR